MVRTACLAAAALALAGCEVNLDRDGHFERESKSIELDKSEMARVEIKFGVGELNVEGGSPKLMDADFEYNIRSWKPIVRYDPSGFRSYLTIEQPSSSSGPHVHYRWNLRFNDKLPMDIEAHLGVGDARMDLGSMNLRSVDVHMGVGELRLDLRGEPKKDYDVSIEGGVGEATVYLPKNVRIVADASGGIGGISTHGLQKDGDRWVNAGHEHDPVTVRVRAHGGIGQINLNAE